MSDNNIDSNSNLLAHGSPGSPAYVKAYRKLVAERGYVRYSIIQVNGANVKIMPTYAVNVDKGGLCHF